MDKKFLKDVTYGSLLEIVSNRDYYYYSPVGKEYSHFSDEGEQAIIDFAKIIAYNMLEVRDTEDEQRSRDIVLNELKGKHDD
tara:strand:- start:677 stop:922 length:246 start_codon:yes stop_codon:yes gene_type:complete